MENLVLTDEERNSAVWQKVDKYLSDQLDTLRKANDNPQDAEKTADIRGQIKFIKRMRNETKEKPKHKADGVRYGQ